MRVFDLTSDSVPAKVLRAAPADSTFTVTDMVNAGIAVPAAIHQALARLNRSGHVERRRKGEYRVTVLTLAQRALPRLPPERRQRQQRQHSAGAVLTDATNTQREVSLGSTQLGLRLSAEARDDLLRLRRHYGGLPATTLIASLLRREAAAKLAQ